MSADIASVPARQMSEPPSHRERGDEEAHVMTVRGPVDPLTLGPTLMHEHVFIDLSAWYETPQDPELSHLIDAVVDITNVEALRKRPLGLCRQNLVLDDENLAVQELDAFASRGGAALVDCTVLGIGRNPTRVRRVSERTGLHIVLGTGIYVERSHPQWVRTATVEAIADLFTRDVLDGIDDSGIRAGIIGEIGTSGIAFGQRNKCGTMTDQEKKVLRAAGRAAVTTGAPVSVHLDPNSTGAFDVIDVLTNEGVRADRMIMCHIDAVADLSYHLAIAQHGVYLEYDHFGRHYATKNVHGRYTTDSQRIEFLGALMGAGYQDRILVSQDVCLKIDLCAFGGVGYGHILNLLDTFRESGISDEQIALMLVHNPRRALTIEPSAAPY